MVTDLQNASSAVPRAWKELPDEEVVAVFRDGECPHAREEAAGELFHRHHQRVSRWCYRFTRDRETALDLAQEILLRAYRNIGSYRGDCRFSTWLYVIARNYCMSALQRRACEPVWNAKTLAIDIPDPGSGNVHTAVERAQSRQRVWDFIRGTLDHMETRVMLLHYGNEVPLDAVNRMLGLTNKSGAKAYIVSARRKLTAALAAGRDCPDVPAARSPRLHARTCTEELDTAYRGQSGNRRRKQAPGPLPWAHKSPLCESTVFLDKAKPNPRPLAFPAVTNG
jgi:RNA polymerase sigma-70 factor (ECF subfamily)